MSVCTGVTNCLWDVSCLSLPEQLGRDTLSKGIRQVGRAINIAPGSLRKSKGVGGRVYLRVATQADALRDAALRALPWALCSISPWCLREGERENYPVLDII